MARNESQARILSFVERIERLLSERKEINAAIADVKSEAKSAGYEVAVLNQMIKERAMTEDARKEWIELCELYRASLGMLDSTPLGEAARRRFDPSEDTDDKSDDPPDGAPSLGRESRSKEAPPATLNEARERGGADFRDGKRVTENPFNAGDPCRAAWDEGWCIEAGSDGMDIPPAWRRTTPKKDTEQGADT